MDNVIPFPPRNPNVTPPYIVAWARMMKAIRKNWEQPSRENAIAMAKARSDYIAILCND